MLDAGGLYHSHMAGDASLPTNFQFGLLFINNLHLPEAHLTRYLPYNLRLAWILRDREGEQSSSFDKWMSSDEKKISEEHERREGKRAKH